MHRARGAKLASPTRIDLEGTYNVRDIGGYMTTTGETVRRSVFYRADDLGKLTAEGRKRALTLNLDTVIDLRTDTEVARHPNVFADGLGPRYLRLDMVGDPGSVVVRGDPIALQRRDERGAFCFPVERLIDSYTAILDDRKDLVRDIVSTLAGVNRRPMIYHCVGGQDRTGLVTALVLAIAGVDDDTIAFDYGETAVHNIRRFRKEKNQEQLEFPIHTAADYRQQLCPPRAMRGTLDHLHRAYGGPVAYLMAAGVDMSAIERLRRALTG